MAARTVVIGMLGTTLDQGSAPQRWDRWRPTVALGQHPDLLVDRLELLYSRNHRRLADTVIKDLAHVSPETTVVSHDFALNDPWDFEEVYGALYDFAKSYQFDTDNEDYLVHITTGTHVVQICLFLLTESRHLPARLLQTGPGGRKDNNPAGTYSVIDLDLSRYDRLAARFHQETAGAISFLKSGIDTANHQFNRLIERIEKVGAESTEPILLTGPTGAGKSRLARLIYDLRVRRRLVEGDFVEVNCATIRGDAAMSSLFGHRKGAFTGAADHREGLLRKADGGLLFLDEVGELGLDEQTMLLKAVEEKRFFPLGSDQEVRSDFQLICGTNRNLRELAACGKFREDLLARIDLWVFRLPGLAERPEDIEPNLDYELAQYAGKKGRKISFSREARKLFLELAAGPGGLWRANFRDLSAGVMRMATLAPGGRITVETVKEEWERLTEQWRELGGGGRDDEDAAGRDILRKLLGDGLEELDLFDQLQLAAVVKAAAGCRTLSEAGRLLFAKSRQSKARPNDADRLRKFLAAFGLSWDDIRAAKG
ncbi:transcriptional regulator [Deltaproteobacteria bacterium Smac51]|nr:transcriptional regulator [Deltaproteobacteria bacterium Smac51]